MSKTKMISVVLITFIIQGCATVPHANNPERPSGKATLTVLKDYDTVWQAAIGVVSEVQPSEGYFFSITSSDKSAGVISAHQEQAQGSINIIVKKVDENRTTLSVNAAIIRYTYSGVFYGQRLNEKWENADPDFASEIADHISLEAGVVGNKPMNDIFLKVAIDKSQIKVGDHATLEYKFYTKYNTTILGFRKYLRIDNQLINSLFQRSDGKGTYYEEGPYFGISPVWDTSKGMVKIVLVNENSPASGFLQPEDQIKSMNGEGIKDTNHFLELLGKQTLDKETEFVVLRQGKELTVGVVPGKSWVPWMVLNRGEVIRFGFDTAFDANGVLKVTDGDKTSQLKAGDIIKEVNGLVINSQNDWRKINNVLSEDKVYTVVVVRNGASSRVEIKPEKKKIHVTAEYLPIGTPIKERLKLNGRQYVASIVQKIRLRFDQPGEFVIDPGAAAVGTDIWGMKGTRIVESETIPVRVIP